MNKFVEKSQFYWASSRRAEDIKENFKSPSSLGGVKTIIIFVSERKYRNNNISAYSDWENLMVSIPQGLVLRLTLFKLYISDFFRKDGMSKSITTTYSDTKLCIMHLATLYRCKMNLIETKSNLAEYFTIFECFEKIICNWNEGKRRQCWTLWYLKTTCK